MSNRIGGERELLRDYLLFPQSKEIITQYNNNVKHQQDLVQTEMDICRCIPAGTHGSTPHLLKTIVTVRK